MDIEVQLNPVSLQDRRKHGARFGLLHGENAIHAFNDADLDAKPGKHLGQLEPDRPTAEDDERGGQVIGLDGLAVRPVFDPVQAGDRRHRGRRPGRDHDRS